MDVEHVSMWIRGLGCALLVAACAFALCAPTHAQLNVAEQGFRVQQLPAGVGAKGVECSPGGVWGEYVYVADSAAGVIERIDPLDNMSTFSTGYLFPVGMAFGPGPAGTFGDNMYVADFIGNALLQVDTSGVRVPFAAAPQVSDCAFDPSGTYGNDLFMVAGSGVNRFVFEVVSAGGVPTLPPFSTAVIATYLDFGPGGAWGSGMYATDLLSGGIAKIASDGSATAFATGFTQAEGFDWAEGPRFGGDLFATANTAGEIRRVDSTGAWTLWATLPGAADLSWCNDSLYAVSAAGECWKVGACAVYSPFDADTEGFSPVDSTAIAWQSSGGNPGGYLEVADQGSDTTRVETSLEYLGDWRPLNGKGYLSFDVQVFDTGGQPITGAPTIEILSQCGSATYTFATSPTTGGWTNYDVELDGSLWTLSGGSWEEILANLYWVDLLLDFTDGDDVSGLDNVCLGPVAPGIVLFSGESFCDDADGSLASCPCANPGDPDSGCDIPQGTGGVRLDVLAQDSSPNRATLTGVGFSTMGSPTAIVIRSNALDSERPIVFGDGLRCVATSPLVRLAAMSALDGVSTHTFGHSAMAGCGLFYYQLWFRSNPSTYCDPAAAFNLSNGRALLWPVQGKVIK